MNVPVDSLLQRIEGRNALVGVVGLGYVGLPVALSFAEAGFDVVGVDLDRARVDEVEAGRSYLRDVPDERLAALKKGRRMRATTSYRRLANADAILICVPTPLTEGTPDVSRVIAAGRALGNVLKSGALVILESTTYPGTTEELLRPLLEVNGLVAGRDFSLAYSPERIDPGSGVYSFEDIPKVVGGIDAASTKLAAALYGQVVPKIVAVSGTREAELAKLIENTFRHVNIALVNELAVYAHELGIDIWEAIEAAATKPFGFLPFWPGPGWGGHCIPLDPAFLSWRVRRDRAHDVRFVELAHTVNSEMPRYVSERAALLLNDRAKPVKGARVLGIGLAYKGGTEDTRGSPGLKVLENLARRGAKIRYHDPLVEHVTIYEQRLQSTRLTPKLLNEQDLVLVLVPQVGIDWSLVAKEAPLVLDCCNALRGKGRSVVTL